ncbi:MAG TPA: endo-1,4-beta-xylanase [Hanamia sp.]
MKIKIGVICAFTVASLFICSCKKTSDTPGTTQPPPTNPPPISDTSGTLKDAADFDIGIAVDYSPFLNNSAYLAVVAREADNVTFGYNMKNGAIVKDDGSFDFSNADAMLNVATSAGLKVYGHTLVWHENQNATYLNSLTAGAPDPSAPNILLSGGFETNSAGSFSNWSVYNTNGATVSTGSGASEIHSGTASLKIVNPNNFPSDQWKVQIASDLFNTTVNTPYKVSFWIKSLSGAGSERLSTLPTAQYQSDIATTSDWKQITWTFQAKDPQTRILFDMGGVANTYFIDDVTVSDATPVAPIDGSKVAIAIDSALSRFIRATVTHYAGKVKAWDVVNESMADGASGLRTSANTAASNATDRFFWSDYLGRDYALKAFQYAKAADPNALLFINDYNLEYNSAKLDSLINYVAELKSKGAQIDGIGTQMHISINTSKSGIDDMFQKLAATGLKIRVSELDVRINPNNTAGFTPTPALFASQADMYKYVVQSFLKYVPAPQRFGITIWGVNDGDSWIITSIKQADNPLLFDDNFSKKPAFYSFLLGLKGK